MPEPMAQTAETIERFGRRLRAGETTSADTTAACLRRIVSRNES